MSIQKINVFKMMLIIICAALFAVALLVGYSWYAYHH
jgi:hypothetical protein